MKSLLAVLLSAILSSIVAASVVTVMADDGPTSDRVSEQRAVLGTAFTYQGRLDTGAGPATGIYDFEFRLFDGPFVGVPVVTNPLFVAATRPVTNGLFSIDLDFGNAGNVFDGNARWLEVKARVNGGPTFDTLEPRQQLTPVPYALFAMNAWSVTGNAGTTGTNFLGTTDNTALELRVNGQRALRLEPNATSPSVIGGYGANVISPFIRGATIGGGGRSGSVNSVSADYGTIGGGHGNTVSGVGNTVGGGSDNTVSNLHATVSGGSGHTASGFAATVVGGQGNVASGNWATVAGGATNVAAGDHSFAAGLRAKALHQGAFVWADTYAADFVSIGPASFSVRATGGVRFLMNPETGWACNVAAGTSWSCTSDRNAKSNFVDVDGRDVLAKLEEVPIQRWTAKGVEGAPPHMGPMAQDFFAAFGLGDSDKSIATIDIDGVSLAAIKGLHAIGKEQEQRIAALEARLASPGDGEVVLASNAEAATTAGQSAPQTTAVVREVGGIPASAVWALAAMLGLFAVSIFALTAVQLRRRM